MPPEMPNASTVADGAGIQDLNDLAGELVEQSSKSLDDSVQADTELESAEFSNEPIERFIAEFYQASPVKRKRSTKVEVERRRSSLYEIVGGMKPMTVRQVFYQATVRGVVEKSEAGYTKVQTDLVHMRRSGDLPYSWLADNTRWQRKPNTFNSIKDALEDTARFYRKALWTDVAAYAEVWLEKDALAGVILPITSQYDVPLMVARGYASLSFLHSAAECLSELSVPAYIYHLGDFDPSGVNAGEKIEETLRELAPDAEIHFERIAVNHRQIAAWNLPTRPTKKSDTRSKNFGDISVELDAIEPDQLRGLVLHAIERHLPRREFEVLRAAEESERELLRAFVGKLDDVGDVRSSSPPTATIPAEAVANPSTVEPADTGVVASMTSDDLWQVGAACFHSVFGNGDVVEVDGNKLTIFFHSVGTKRVVDSFVSAGHREGA